MEEDVPDEVRLLKKLLALLVLDELDVPDVPDVPDVIDESYSDDRYQFE